MNRRFFVTVIAFMLISQQLATAQVVIKGRVIDAKSGDPVIGASVTVVDSDPPIGVVVDYNGDFSIEVPDMNVELHASFIGYEGLTMKASQNMLMKLDDGLVQLRKERREVLLTESDKRVVSHVNDLAFRLMREFPRQQSTVFSPLSIACLLSLTNDGAAGRTRAELTRLLGAEPEETDSFYLKMIPYFTDSRIGSCFQMANALFVNNRFALKDEFRQQCTDNYAALVRNMDFSKAEAVREVNDWVSRQTRGLIPGIVDSTEPDALLYGLNAVYFESTWVCPFEKKDTRDEYFSLENGTRRKMPMMHRKSSFFYSDQKGYTALRMPYKGEVRYDMTVLLPDEGHSVAEVLQHLTPEAFSRLQNEMSNEKVDVKLPRFESEVRLHLNELLCQLGIPTAFDESRSDFSLMADVTGYGPDARLCISKILQKAKIEVNEEGTRAAAVTFDEVMVTGYGGKPKPRKEFVFHADRPFLYVITEQTTGTILFIGQYHGQ